MGFAPSYGNYKIYIIDEVHMLTKEAFNALLKTLEEPPKKVLFFFATTEPHKIPATILSRCQKFTLGRIPHEKIKDKLTAIAKKIDCNVDTKAFSLIADLAEGGLRDAESLFDQLLAYDSHTITYDTMIDLLGLAPSSLLMEFDQACQKGVYGFAFTLTEKIFASGKNLIYFTHELITHFREILWAKNQTPIPEKYSSAAQFYTEELLVEMLELLMQGQKDLKVAFQEKIALEILLLSLIKKAQSLSYTQLLARLEQLEHSKTFTPEKQRPIPKLEIKNPPDVSKKKLVPLHKLETFVQFAVTELNGTMIKH